jgi:hypothetical protein
MRSIHLEAAKRGEPRAGLGDSARPTRACAHACSMREIGFSIHAVSEFAGLFGSCATMLSNGTSRRVASVLLK